MSESPNFWILKSTCLLNVSNCMFHQPHIPQWSFLFLPPSIYPLLHFLNLVKCTTHGSNWGSILHFSLYQWKVNVEVTQSCPTLCAPLDHTVHGILQARVLEWVAFPFSKGNSQPRDWTQVSHIAGDFFTSWATREAHVQAEDNHKLDICSEYGKMWTEESADTYRAQLDGTSCI